MSSHEEFSTPKSHNTKPRTVFLTDGLSLFEVAEYSINVGLGKDNNPITGAILEDCKTNKRTRVALMSLLALREVRASSPED
jgi:hypothetical protein